MAKRTHGGKRSAQTARSAKRLVALGYIVGNVERFNWHTKRRNDLFGFIDLLAVRGDEVLGVQVTSAENIAKHETKARALDTFPVWMRSASRRFVIHGWRRPGVKFRRWRLVERAVELAEEREEVGT